MSEGSGAALDDDLVALLARGVIPPEQAHGPGELRRLLAAAGRSDPRADVERIAGAARGSGRIAGVEARAAGRRLVLALDASTRGTITLHRGDNLAILSRLADASIDLIYIDPPFNTGRAQSRTSMRTARDDDGDRQGFRGLRYRTVKIGRGSFADAFDDYLAFLAPRLEEAHRLLRPTGSLLLHLDYREVHYAKVLLDQIFGRDAFINEIIWAYDYGARATRRWSPKHDNILWYARDPRAYTFDYAAIDRIPYMAPGLVGADKAARGKTPTDTWWHTIVSPSGREKTGYPTQKPLGVIGRLVRVHSRRGDTLLDFFAGSGTLGEAAAAHGRHAILIDESAEAEAVMRRRLARFLAPASTPTVLSSGTDCSAADDAAGSSSGRGRAGERGDRDHGDHHSRDPDPRAAQRRPSPAGGALCVPEGPPPPRDESHQGQVLAPLEVGPEVDAAEHREVAIGGHRLELAERVGAEAAADQEAAGLDELVVAEAPGGGGLVADEGDEAAGAADLEVVVGVAGLGDREVADEAGDRRRRHPGQLAVAALDEVVDGPEIEAAARVAAGEVGEGDPEALERDVPGGRARGEEDVGLGVEEAVGVDVIGGALVDEEGGEDVAAAEGDEQGHVEAARRR